MNKYKLNKHDGGPMDAGKAKGWMKKYEDRHPGEIRAYFFGSDIIRKIIDHGEAVGMRIYFAEGDDGKMQMVLIGTREDGSNIWPTEGKDAGGGTVGDSGVPCPPYC